MNTRGGQDFKTLKAKLIRNGELFVDNDFPALLRSIYPSGVQKDPSIGTIYWTRPTDLVEDPKFLVDGATRFDVEQGHIGDCWFIAAASTLISTSKKLFQRVCPLDQTFERGSYAGIFHFYFWRYGKWTEVIIDDRLPTYFTWGRWGKEKKLLFALNKEQPNEFWAALIEKAYAKLNGSYEALNGGSIQNALIDMTGGISEVFDLKVPRALPKDLFQLLQKTHKMNSMMGVSIPVPDASTASEKRRPNGLYEGHAYSITDILGITINGRKVELVRLRNPWGEKEWNGPWSDGSQEWKSLSDADRRRYEVVVRDDGEFWMPFDVMVSEFDKLGICHLTPDSLTKEVAEDMNRRTWQVVTYDSEWVRGWSAGGCGNPPHQDLYWTNPQYHVELKDPDEDEDDGLCTLITSLMEKENKTDKEYLAIGLDVFKLRPDTPSKLLNAKKLDLRALSVLKRTDTYVHNRQMSYRLRVEPGKYVLIPSTFVVAKEASFILRIFTHKPVPSSILDNTTGPIVDPEKPPKVEESLIDLFKRHAGSDYALDAKELSRVLNDYYKDDIGDDPFSTECARNLIPMNDLNSTGSITYSELDKMIKEMDAWKKSFYAVDRNKSGTVDVGELTSLLTMIGFSLSRRVLGAVVRRYGGKARRLSFCDFLVCISRVMIMYGLFKHYAPGGEEKVELTLEEWMYSTLYY